jgi:hypothetical protein
LSHEPELKGSSNEPPLPRIALEIAAPLRDCFGNGTTNASELVSVINTGGPLLIFFFSPSLVYKKPSFSFLDHHLPPNLSSKPP